MITEGSALKSQPSPPSPAMSRVRSIFLKDGGLRARWRFLIFAVIWSYSELALFWVARPLFGRAQDSRLPISALLIWFLSFVAVAIPTAVMARIERRPWGSYGFPVREAFGAWFWKGVLWGLVALTGLMLALRAVGAFHFGGIVLHGIGVVWYGGTWSLVFLMIALFELPLLLGYPQVLLTDRIGFWPAAAVISTFYGMIHLFDRGVHVGNWISGLASGLAALLFCLTLRRTGNLWFVAGMHTSFNWGGAFLYSVPEDGRQATGHLLSSHLQGSVWLTGGSVGPEGSVFGFMMLVGLFAAFHWAYPDVRYPAGGGPAPRRPEIAA
jgi:membrane protease YdiL (CAAX protease family)